ncbi:DUF6942 family protein [Bowmanella denitrificans]|uniref:DUF6942 family protein n=1 Tax=Bowmanella denitrificans TaxID=366582 RepID=UPI000C9B790C|nr:hypothetical protein [Bowmanella denitrificans]
MKHFPLVGLGDSNAQFKVYIANRPKLPQYLSLSSQLTLKQNDIATIGQACGNGWRKVFNVYAKLMFALQAQGVHLAHGFSSWQQYRDQRMLQSQSSTALMFSPPVLDEQQPAIQVICGRTYAQQLDAEYGLRLFWLNAEFAVSPMYRLFVCPYFDYRQLSNLKIAYLQTLIGEYGASANAKERL